jgi:hypothetical protein
VGFTVGALLGGFSSFAKRKRENGDILDILQRMPSGATKRDLLSDPVYQRDLDRRAAGNGNGLDTFLTASLLANSLGSRSGGRYHPARTYDRSFRGARRF